MAAQVEFRTFTPKNSRADLMRRLEEAPEEHAEALLAVYELLRQMHEKGLIDAASGLLSVGETVVSRAADAIGSKQAVIALRLILALSDVITGMDAEKVHQLLLPPEKQPPSLLSLSRQALGPDARVGLAAVVGFLSILGAAIRNQTPA